MYTEYNSQNMNQGYNPYNNMYNNNDDDNNSGNDTGLNKIFGFIWKILLVILVLVLLFLGLVQFGVISLSSDVSPDEIVLNVNEIGIKKGRGYQLTTTVLPENAKNKQVVYESSDPKIASVNEVSGYVKGINVGTAIIKVKTLINNKETECLVNVEGEGVMVQSISLNTKNINLAVGHTYGLSYRITPNNATELGAVFYSSDPSVATVDSQGNVRGVREGNAVITVSVNNGAITDTAYVNIYKKGTTTTVQESGGQTEVVQTVNYPDNISISSKSLSINKGSTAQLQATINPSNAVSALSWRSSNTKVATVDGNGLVTAVGVGSADIVVKTVNNKTASCKITVGNYSVKVSKVNITTKYINMTVGGKSYKLFADITPSNATNRTIYWSSSDSRVATVDSNGNVTAVSPGSVTIKARSADGNHESSATVDVSGNSAGIEVKKISFKKSNYQVGLNSTISLSSYVTYNPSNTTYKSLTYTSSNTNVATVDNNGLVRGVGVGSATITATTKQGGVSANTTISVKEIAATSVALGQTEITLNKGEIFTLKAEVKPENASNKTVSFMSSNQSVAIVDKNGTITAVGSGTATITVKPNGGGASSTCVVRVN